MTYCRLFSALLVGFSVLTAATQAARADEAASMMTKPGFTDDSELGYVEVSGNSAGQTINAKQANEYGWGDNAVKAAFRYLEVESKGTESAHNYAIELRFERQLAKDFGYYVGQSLESDPFSGYDPRLNTDVGGKYDLVRNDQTQWNVELGYRYVNEHRTTSPDVYGHHGRVYMEYNHLWTKTSSGKVWLEYLPDFTNARAYLANAEASVTSQINDIFAIKVAYLVKYDDAPAAGVNFYADTFFTTSLVAKF